MQKYKIKINIILILNQDMNERFSTLTAATATVKLTIRSKSNEKKLFKYKNSTNPLKPDERTYK